MECPAGCSPFWVLWPWTLGCPSFMTVGECAGAEGTVWGSEAVGADGEGRSGRGAARAVGSAVTRLAAPPGRVLLCKQQQHLLGPERLSPRLLLPAPPEVGAPLSPVWDKEARSQEVTDESTAQGRSVAGELQARVLAVTAVAQGAGAGSGGQSCC